MGTKNAYGSLTFGEVAKRLAPDRSTLAIAEVLAEEWPIYTHAPWREANDNMSNREARRLSIPTPTWRKVNAGVGITASRTVPVIDTIGLCEDYSEVDVEIINAFKDKKQARIIEARSHIDGMRQELESTLLYGSTDTTPEEFNGISTRMASLVTAANVLNAGGSGSDLTSIYVVMWGIDKVFMVYPRNSAMGIQHQDLGEVTKSTATTGVASAAQFQAYRDHFVMKAGLVVKDDRCIGRIANIESTGSSNIFDEDDLITLLHRMPKGMKHIYVNDTVAIQMHIAMKDKNNVTFEPGSGEGLFGPEVARCLGNPIYKADEILITEEAIS